MTKISSKSFDEFAADLRDSGYDDEVIGRVWDGLQLLSEDDPMSQRSLEKRGQERRRPHTRQDRQNRQNDMGAPLEDTRDGGPGLNPSETPLHTQPGQKYYDPKDVTNTHRDKRSMPWNFKTTDQEVTEKTLYSHFDTVCAIAQKSIVAEAAISAKHPGQDAWFVITDKKGHPTIGAHIVHFASEGDEKKNPLLKFFDDEVRPIWAPDFLSTGYCIVFPYSMLGKLCKMLGIDEEKVKEQKPAPMSKFIGPEPSTSDHGSMQPKRGRGQKGPDIEASVVQADGPNQGLPTRNESTAKKKKSTLRIIPVRPEYTPMPMPDPSLKVGDWWSQMRYVPQGVSPYLAPGGVRVMGDSKRLSDVFKEFISPGLKNSRRQLLPGLGERFGPGGRGPTTNEKRDKDDVAQPKVRNIGNDRTKVNTNTDGTKSSFGTRDSINNKQFNTPSILPRKAAYIPYPNDNGERVDINSNIPIFDDFIPPPADYGEYQRRSAMTQHKRETPEGQTFRELGNSILQNCGISEWPRIHGLFKIAENADGRASTRDQQSRSQPIED